MPIVRIARHGETTWNVEGRYQGRLESELSPLGVRQADALAQALRSTATTRIICSPLHRTRMTARPISALLGVPIEEDVRLIEIAHGTWEGRLRDELARNDPQRYRAWRSHPETVAFENGESIAQVWERWSAFASDFQVDRETLIVTHDAIVRLAILAGASRPLEDFWKAKVVNGGYAQFSVERSTWVLDSECVDDFLAGLHADLARQAL
ncbi:MAG: histidine phosphatase family protein, partial [Candidatus Baltobacteraceae bacterium]